MREHNRVAEKLQQLNQGWSDEKIFQEAKRFVTAEYQHIVYNEWLPSIIGKKYMNLFGLYPLNSGYSNDYDPTCNPSMFNEFATAAFRYVIIEVNILFTFYRFQFQIWSFSDPTNVNTNVR